jgi:hypothetical protein
VATGAEDTLLSSGSGNVVTGNGSTGATTTGVATSSPIGSTVRSGSTGAGSAGSKTAFSANSASSAAGIVRIVGGKPTLAGSEAEIVGPDSKMGDLDATVFKL